ncbi:MAG TPA: hypothetical protein VF178_15975, partial [Gemmatimonadaceae bacterium]
ASLVAGTNITLTHGAGTITIDAAGGGGGGLTAPTLRSSAIQSSSASSYNVTFPTGATAGDVCVLMAGHGYQATNPTGWTVIDNLAGGNFNGGGWAKQLTSADITTGYVTLSFAGAYNGVIAIVCFEGVTGAIRTHFSERNSGGASTRTLSTSWDIAATDYVLYFGAHRANDTVTCSVGDALQTVSASEASGVLTGEVPATAGVISAVWSYPTTPSGDYQILIALEGT